MCFLPAILSQTKYTINGVVTDVTNGETLPGATITVEELSGVGTASNAYGYFGLTLPEGSYTLKIQYVGYQTINFLVNVNQNLYQNFKMESIATSLQEIKVTPYRLDDKILTNDIGVEKIQISEIKNIPVFFGERDVLKTITLTPGITSVRDGESGVHVRGGNNSQNLILLDETTVYYPYHLLGFFSTFNSEAIKDVTVYKGTAPTSYGGRISSVMDIRMKDGNNQTFEVNGGLGLIASNLTVEGPIVKEKGSFLVAGRRTHIDMLLKLTKDPELSSRTLNFYDLNAKVNFTINPKNRIFLSAYTGRDALRMPNHLGVSWGNQIASFKWNHIWHDKIFSNTSIHFSEFDYMVDFEFEPSTFSLYSELKDYCFKHEFQFFLGNNNRPSAGLDLKSYNITPGQLIAGEDAMVHPVKIKDKTAKERSFYLSNEIKTPTNWIINFGIRLNFFSLYGIGTYYIYTDGLVTDSLRFYAKSPVKTYFTPERRINITHIIDNKQSVKVAYSNHSQNIHKISSSDASLPIDIWLMSSTNVKPEISDQFTAGYFRNFRQDMYQFSAETYFKWMHDAIDLRTGANIKANEHIEGQLLFGHGRSYGLELLLKKATGKLHGWLGYNLSRTELSIIGINNGAWYPARQDMTNDVSVVGMYDFSDKWTLSATWVYQTGNAVTFPSGKYEINGEVRYNYDKRNANRMPDYHRLDVGLTWNLNTKGRYKSSLNLSVYNAYARKNAFSINFKQDPANPDKTIAVMTYLFTAIPSITYNFHF